MCQLQSEDAAVVLRKGMDMEKNMDSSETGLVALLDSVTSFEREHELREAFNIFDAVGMRTQEIRHSRFLAFLLDPLAMHGLGEYFLRTFLEHVMAESDSPAMTRLAVILADLSAAEVYTERDHFDITVWLPQQKLLLVIENKIGASESSNQLLKYRERVKQQYPEEKFCGVFLTADGYDGDDPDWISVGYTTIFSQLQTLLLQDPSAVLAPDVRMAVKHYSQLIRKHIVTDETLIEACRSIYAKHRSALDLIIKHGQVSLVREAAQRFLKKTTELHDAGGGNSLRVNMVGSAWKDISSFRVADTSRWGHPFPLQFWFRLDERKSMLNLHIEVGPVREDATATFNRSDLVEKLRTVFNVHGDRRVTNTYTSIKRYSKQVKNADDISNIEEAMETLWNNDFGGSDKLECINNIIKNLVPCQLPAMAH